MLDLYLEVLNLNLGESPTLLRFLWLPSIIPIEC